MKRRKLALVAAVVLALAAASWVSLRGRGTAPIAAAPLAQTQKPPAGARRVAMSSGAVRPGAASMLHLDPHHSNRSPFEGPRSAKVAWTFDTGGPVQAAVVELDDGTLVATSLSGKLFALSPTGVQRFALDLGDRVYATPLALDDRIFVGSDAHRFFAIDHQGNLRLQLQTDGDADTAAVPTPGGGVVFASGRIVYAAKLDGTLLWRVQAKRKCYSSPAVADDGTTYVGSQDDHLYAIDAQGVVRFRVNLGADVDSAPVLLDDGTVVVGTDRGQVVALEPSHGDVRWTAEVGGYVRGALSVMRDGTILAATYGPTPRVVALSADGAKQRTVFAMAGAASADVGIHGAPVEDAVGTLFFGAQDDAIYAVESDGSLVWKFRTGGDVDAPVVITTRGLLVVGSDDGKIYALGGT